MTYDSFNFPPEVLSIVLFFFFETILLLLLFPV